MIFLSRIYRFLFLLPLLSLLTSPLAVQAQESPGEAPYYLVQPGDSLYDIAARFKISMDDLESANGITNPDQIKVGQQLALPGIAGLYGSLVTRTVAFGESLSSMAHTYGIPETDLALANRMVSPAEWFAGVTVIVPEGQEQRSAQKRAAMGDGQTWLELAALQGDDPWQLALANEITETWHALPGDVIHVPSENENDPSALPVSIKKTDLKPLILAQGKTAVISVTLESSASISGSLAGLPLHFFPYRSSWVALQGIHTLTQPGLYPLALNGRDGTGRAFAFSQMVRIKATAYQTDPVLIVDSQTIDPKVTEPEDALWKSLGAPVTPEKLWEGRFQSPVPVEFRDCWTSLFGNRRSFNGSPYQYYHSGLDFCGSTGTELYAAAAGQVVYTGSLVVRGNVTVINHGWGIYTAYDHQSEIFVKPGDWVTPGQRIGLGGATGRTTGPHLHWEVWVGGSQVDPVDWLERVFP